MKAVYYISNNRTWGHVATQVWDILKQEYGKAQPRYMRNLLLAYEKNRKALGLMDYHVVTEATHWSGVHEEWKIV